MIYGIVKTVIRGILIISQGFVTDVESHRKENYKGGQENEREDCY